MGTFTIFNKVTSRSRIVSGPVSNEGPPLNDDEVYFPGEHRDKIIIIDEVSQKITLHDKPASRITLTGTKLENLPNPTRVTITGNGATFRRSITDGTYKFSIDVPGVYTVECRSRIELPIEFKVTI